MKRMGFLAVLLLLAYFASGLFVVKGNEQAVVRRFGNVLRSPNGDVALWGSGLHYDLPWPWVVVDRVNLNEVRTLSIGVAERDDFQSSGLLLDGDAANPSQFLTGDKNVLNLQINVQYRIAESGVQDFLFASEAAERNLVYLVESTASNFIARSGVDFVHPLGLGELRELITRETRRLVAEQRLGIEVDEVSISSVYPPVRVKAYFLDVSNARADKDKYINAANAYAEQRLAAARAEARRVVDQAEIYRQETIELARSRADSFTKLIEQFRLQEQQGIHSYAVCRFRRARVAAGGRQGPTRFRQAGGSDHLPRSEGIAQTGQSSSLSFGTLTASRRSRSYRQHSQRFLEIHESHAYNAKNAIPFAIAPSDLLGPGAVCILATTTTEACTAETYLLHTPR